MVYSKNWGTFTENTLQPVASASKWLSAGVIMSLVDEGKLSLNDTLGKFLPLFTKNKKGNITIRQCFSHTSGYPGDSPEGFESRKDLSLAQAVDSLAEKTKVLYAPGKSFYYGGVGMQIAGRVAEVVSGKVWQTLFDERVATPCNLGAIYSSVKNPLIAGGAITTPRSYLNFLEMIVNKGTFNGKRVLSENAISEMLKDQTNGAVIAYSPYAGGNLYSPYDNKVIRYGIGNWRDVVVPATDEAEESSSPGLFGTHPWRGSKHNVAGIIFTYSDYLTVRSENLKIRQLVREQLK